MINVAIIGVGNCASSLVQGVHYYRQAKEDEHIPGIMHVNLGGYHISDINFVAAFDVDKNKVGKDLAEAIFTKPNNTFKFCDVPATGVKVARGMTHDGLGKYLSQIIEKAPGPTANIVQILKETKTDVVLNYLPVGSEEATKWYIEQVLDAGCAFVNCIPVFIAREEYWQGRFEERGLPIIGDDIKSQVGATIVHRVLTRLFVDRGVKLERTYQLNFGGNTDFLNMLERDRLESKKISKTNSVTSQLDYQINPDDIHVGPSDYVPWLLDRKFCHIRMEGRTFGDVPLNLELKLEVWDSPNSAGVVIDAIRCGKLALDRGLKGSLIAPSAYFMKSPPVQYTDNEARRMVEEFIVANRTEKAAPSPGKFSITLTGNFRVKHHIVLIPADVRRFFPDRGVGFSIAVAGMPAISTRVRSTNRMQQNLKKLFDAYELEVGDEFIFIVLGPRKYSLEIKKIPKTPPAAEAPEDSSQQS